MSATDVLDRLRRRLPGDGRLFSLREAIDAFEESYRHDRLDGTDSITIVGWPKPDVPAFDLALGRSIDGGACEFPTIVTAALLLPLAEGDSFEMEVDEEFKQLDVWSPGQVFFHCKDYSDADAYFARLRNLAVVRKYGDAAPISCKLQVPDDDQKSEIASKLVEYFAEHGWPGVDGPARLE
jgi:hypothetical protein